MPDTSKLPGELKTQLAEIEAQTRVELPVSLGRADVVADLRRLAELAEASARIQLAAVLDTDGLDKQLAQLGQQQAAPPLKVPVADPIDTAFQAKMRADLRKLAGTLELNVPAGVQGEVLRRQVSAQIKAVERGLELEVPTKPGDAAEYRRRLNDQLRLIERTVEATVPVEIDLEVPASEQAEVIAKTTATKRLLERNPVRIPLDIDTAQLDALSRRITALGGTLTGLGVGAAAGQATAGGLVALAAAVAQTAGALALIPAAGAAGVAVVGTLILGLHGLSDALSADTPAQYAEALKKVSPEARELVQALRDLAPLAQSLREAVQDRLLRDLSDDARDLGQVYLPLLEHGFGGIADELRGAAGDLGLFLREARSVSVLRSTLEDSKRATALLSEALRPAARGVRDLVDVGSDFLPGLAAQVGVLAERWSVMIERSADSGRLHEWISQALDQLGDLLGIVGNVGRVFGAVFRAGADDGRQLLDMVRDITGELADFAGSAEGQEAIGSFLGAAADMARALLPLLRSVVSVVGGDLAPLLARVGETVVPALVSAVDALGRGFDIAGPGVEAFAGGVAAVIEGLAEGGAIEAVAELAGVVGTNLGQALTLVGPKLGELITALADELAEALPELVPAAIDLALALGDLLISASPLIGVVAGLVGQVGLPTLTRVAERLAPIIGGLADKLAGGRLDRHFEDIADAAVEWVDAVAPLTEEIVDLAWEIVRGLLPHLPELIRSSADLAEAMVPVAKAVVAVTDALADLSEASDKIVDSVPGLRAALGAEGLVGSATMMLTPLGPLKTLYDALANMDEALEGGTRGIIFHRIGEDLVSLDELRERAESTFLGLRDIVTTHAPFLTDIVLEQLGRMQDGSLSIWGRMLADATDHWGRMEQDIADQTLGISDAVTAAWERVAAETSRQWAETDRRVAQGVRDVADETRLLPGQVTDALGQINQALYPAGVSLIQGFVLGMKAQEFAVRRAAASIMEAASGYFPRSPAKYGAFSGRGWTPYRGAALVAGFAEGMRSEVAGVVRAADQVTRSVSAQLPTAGTFAPSGTAPAGGATVNVYPQPGQSEESIGRAAARRLARGGRTR
ncbi:hypothetical protein ACFP3R_16485 [Saccharothrix lopnurensis]|uniref:Phage-related protein n=1 Tax=Saccharothrix lopnurensis TaxID=1670621 RepID=A0ABW1P624_9PSEU